MYLLTSNSVCAFEVLSGRKSALEAGIEGWVYEVCVANTVGVWQIAYEMIQCHEGFIW